MGDLGNDFAGFRDTSVGGRSPCVPGTGFDRESQPAASRGVVDASRSGPPRMGWNHRGGGRPDLKPAAQQNGESLDLMNAQRGRIDEARRLLTNFASSHRV